MVVFKIAFCYSYSIASGWVDEGGHIMETVMVMRIAVAGWLAWLTIIISTDIK